MGGRWWFCALVALLAVAGPAHADWSGGSISGFGQDHYSFGSAGGNSGFLRTSCSSMWIMFEPDISGAAGTATVHVYRCSIADADNCRKILADRDGDGIPEDVPLTGTETTGHAGYTWVQGAYIQVRPVGLPAAGVTAKLTVRCMGN